MTETFQVNKDDIQRLLRHPLFQSTTKHLHLYYYWPHCFTILSCNRKYLTSNFLSNVFAWMTSSFLLVNSNVRKLTSYGRRRFSYRGRWIIFQTQRIFRIYVQVYVARCHSQGWVRSSPIIPRRPSFRCLSNSHIIWKYRTHCFFIHWVHELTHSENV